MGIPANLSSVPAATPYIQYVSTNGQTVFPYPFPITQDSDLIVVINGVTQNTDAGYSLSGVGNPTGGNVIFTAGQTAGAIITIYREIAIERITQFAQNSGFSSAAFNAEYNNIYLILQQLQDAANFALSVPNTNTPTPTTVLQPANYANKYLSFDANGNPTPAALVAGTLTQAIISGLLTPQTPAEFTAGVVPTNFAYPPGCPRRYGAVGNGIADDTAALTTCLSCNGVYIGYPGDSYGVTTVTFPASNPRTVYFNDSNIKGIATAANPQTCIVRIESNFTNFYDYVVIGAGNGSTIVTPNPNYTCGTQWQGSTQGSQFNNFYGMLHFDCVRGLVYGVTPGNSSNLILSENAVFGFRSVGVSNPLYINNSSAFLHLSNPTLFCDSNGWTNSTMPASARMVEIVAGNLYAQGGEMEFAEVATGFAADLQSCTLVGMNWECSPPVRIIGDKCRIVGGQFLNNQDSTSAFAIANGVTGSLELCGGFNMFRPSGVGATSAQTMVDASLADPSFTTILDGTSSQEWKHGLVASSVRLVTGGKVAYRNHRYQQTTGQPIFNVNSEPHNSLLSDAQLDHMGYTTTGWTLVTSAGGTTNANTTSAGPSGYNASQLTLTATGQAAVLSGDPTSLATIKGSMLRTRPGELFWGSMQCNMTNGTSSQAIVSFYDIAGTHLASTAFADATGIAASGWNFVEGPVAAPASAAYAALGVQITVNGTLLYTDARLQRA